jgi:hypothetical protein
MNSSPNSPAEAYFDVSGKRIRKGVSPNAVGVPETLRKSLGLPPRAGPRVTPLTDSETATACLELHSGSSVINIQVTVDLTSYGENNPPSYSILEVFFSGDIYTGPEPLTWLVNQGYMGGVLFIEAQQQAVVINPGEAELGVAESIVILGYIRDPVSYIGIFGYDGDIFEFTHTTLFKGWQACS